MEIRNVVPVDAARPPFSRSSKGKLLATRLDEVGEKVLAAIFGRNPEIGLSMIEEVGRGNVPGRGTEFSYLGNLQRLAGAPLEACIFHSNRELRVQYGNPAAIAIAVGGVKP